MARDWIRRKHMQTGASLNPYPSHNGSDNGPLRRVVKLLRSGSGGIFGRDLFLLECGHEAKGTKGAGRVRCPKCKAKVQGDA